jgi:ABC-2 type transport system permease protein
MVLTAARKELRGMLRDGRVLAGALLLLLLAAVALASAAARFETLASERAVAQSLIAAQWNEQGEKNPHSAAHYGVYAFRPVLPLAFFDPGVLPYAGVSIWLEAHKQNFAAGRPADDMTPLARFGELSLAFILQALVPLGLLLMGHAAFAGEREQGTLRQVLASGITPGRLFVGKFVGIGAAALLLLAPLWLLCLVALAFAGAAVPWGAALSLLLVYLVYFAILLLLALVVSARAASSQAALLTLLAFWAVMTFVLPRVAADVGRIVAPTPTVAQFLRAVDEDIATGMNGDPPAERIAQRREALLRLYKADSEDELPINFQGVVFAIQDEVGNAAYDKHFALLHGAIDRQADVFEATSLLSPRMALALISQELAGTSLAHQRHFERGAEDFRRQLMEILNRDITLNSKPGESDYRAGPELWQRTGEYRYESEPLRLSWARCAAPLTVLALWTLALAIAATVTARHLRVLAA